MKACFIASTGQNVGKTTTCLGLMKGLKSIYPKVGYMKPVGQEGVPSKQNPNLILDKDVILFKNQFNLDDNEVEMSPLLLPRGFTKDYLDNKVCKNSIISNLKNTFNSLSKKNDFLLLEGTGHTGVGSIIDLNNAQVCSLLNLKMILIASGGLGSSFDELELNKTQCEKHGVQVLGVILNRVLSEKKEMIHQYMSKALERWNIPLLGTIPYTPLLSSPTLRDIESIFQTNFIHGDSSKWSHVGSIQLVNSNEKMPHPSGNSCDLFIFSSENQESIISTLESIKTIYSAHYAHPSVSLLVTDKVKPSKELIFEINRLKVPTLFTPVSSYIATNLLQSQISKIRYEDQLKIKQAIITVENNIDFELLSKLI